MSATLARLSALRDAAALVIRAVNLLRTAGVGAISIRLAGLARELEVAAVKEDCEITATMARGVTRNG